MTETTAKIRAKGTDGTGFTEDLAASLFNRVGHTVKAIVELEVVDKHGPNLEGKRKVDMVITSIEVATDSIVDEHLGEISNAIYVNRDLQGHTGTTTQGQERTVADVVASGAKHRPHPFLPVDASEDNPICDVCGTVEATAVHSTQDVLDSADEPDEPDEPDGSDPTHDEVDPEGDPVDPDVDELTDEPAEDEVAGADEYDNTHAYDAGPDDVCLCGLPFEDDIHASPTATPDNEERHLSAVADPFAAPAT